MPTTPLEIARDIAIELIRKSGVREWDNEDIQESIAAAAVRIATLISFETTAMALPDYVRVEPGTAKVFKSSGGDAAITLASVANNAARQSATLDLGATWARRWRITVDAELAATPTAGNTIDLYGSFHSATGAGKGNTSGSDAAYTGYSSNIDNSLKHLVFLGAHICTAQATSTVQKSNVGIFSPPGRYLNLVWYNKSGAAVHSTDTNCNVTLTPLVDKLEDT